MTNTAEKITSDRQVIYDMPAEEYHALQRFSASGIKKILVSAQDFWATSWMNPERHEAKSDAFNLGTAYHTRILEGRKVFDQRYAVMPECDRRTSAGKAIYATWRELFPLAEAISPTVYDEINMAAACQSEFFKGGKAEVTVLWEDEETGVPMKARLDYLKEMPGRSGQINDLKTFSNSSGMDLNRLLAKHIVQYKYHVQQAVYQTAVPECDFHYIFQQVGQVNNCIPLHLGYNLMLAEQGRALMRIGIDKFAHFYRKFGSKAEWTEEFKTIDMTDEDFPMYAYEPEGTKND